MNDKRTLYFTLGVVLALTVGHYFTALYRVEVHDLFLRLYFLPIVYAAYLLGVRGGLVTASLVTLLYVPFILFRIHVPAERFDQSLEVVLFFLVGILTGVLSQRQKNAMRRLERLTLGTIQSLVTAIEAKDPYTKGHSVRVKQISKLIGERMHLSYSEQRLLQIGALLHDLGKIAVDLPLLHKASRLLESEVEIIHKHPEWGVQILQSIDELKPVLPAILHHHERFDGSGYPQHLKEAEIPLLARIISVADMFDAMTTDRPYRNARSLEEAAAEIRSLSGTLLDPEVVRILLSDEILQTLVKADLNEDGIAQSDMFVSQRGGAS